MPVKQATYNEKIIFGFSKIHIAPIGVDGTIGTPVPVLGGKSVECTFDMAEKTIYADNEAVSNDKRIAGAKGKLSVLGLTTDEKCMLMGSKNMSGGYAMKSSDSMPPVAVLFAQEKKDGGQLLTVIYNCTFALPQIQAVATEGGEIEEQISELDFTCITGKNGYYFYTIDSKDSKIDNTLVTNWFTAVQDPKETVAGA